LSSSLLSRDPGADAVSGLPSDEPGGGSGRLLVLFGWLVGPLLAGYMLFDKAFAYIHLPGTPLYVGEMVLFVGALGCLAATGYLRVSIRDDPMLAMLAAFFLWGFIRFLPGLRTYGIYAVRDFALVYYCLFAFFIAAALARSPDILERMIVNLNRFVPWLLLWLPVAEILTRTPTGPNVPFTTIPITTHKGGDLAIAALLALGALWLFPSGRSARSRGLWSIIALIVFALVATQSRGGLLSVLAGLVVGLAFFADRMRLIARAAAATILVVGIGTLASLQIAGTAASQGRAFSVPQLFSNVASIGGAQESGNLNGTVQGRLVLWTETLHKQVSDDRLVYGYGFGPNLAYLAGGVAASGALNSDPLRSPHNSYLDVLARMGVVGMSLWIALWVGWYWRLVRGCRRLAQRGLYVRRRVAVLCLMVVTATLVASFFDPTLEAAQAAALMWTAFGIGLVMTSFRGGFGYRDVRLDRGTAVAGTGVSRVSIGTPGSSPQPLRECCLAQRRPGGLFNDEPKHQVRTGVPLVRAGCPACRRLQRSSKQRRRKQSGKPESSGMYWPRIDTSQ
jgi:O-antigen ligase